MARYHHVASIIFMNAKGEFILQRRDDKPGIRNPGKITAWGGAVEAGETFSQAAVREVSEETNLCPNESDLVFFGTYPRPARVEGAQIVNHVFILNGVDEKELRVYEGQGYEVVDLLAGTDNILYSDLTKELIRDYKKKVG